MSRGRIQEVGREGRLTGSPGCCCFRPPKPGEDQVPLGHVWTPPPKYTPQKSVSCLLITQLLPLFLPAPQVGPGVLTWLGFHSREGFGSHLIPVAKSWGNSEEGGEVPPWGRGRRGTRGLGRAHLALEVSQPLRFLRKRRDQVKEPGAPLTPQTEAGAPAVTPSPTWCLAIMLRGGA